ncbi:hypothetical protein MPNT_190061 [Candidatus Methylacidithermus pantelleriae]|uniref:Uncharacterized protein n=1 Tax=Candidatus Methylacidithermus pantelleriae TaxID=2744239 RepID=A0A8J2BN99_9BACT|nr:hypothetical protein MPNT_190061 [Candidatus Methylacidithermus pantelleriae]
MPQSLLLNPTDLPMHPAVLGDISEVAATFRFLFLLPSERAEAAVRG